MDQELNTGRLNLMLTKNQDLNTIFSLKVVHYKY